MKSQLFQTPCFFVFVIADEFSVVPTSMFSCICYCRWILSCSNLHVFLYLLLQMNSQLFQPPCFLVFVIADEFSTVPTSMFSCICYCRWILSCSNLLVFLYLLLQMNSQLFQPPCYLVFVTADEFSVVPTSMFPCICYCRLIHQLFQPPCFLVFVIAGEFSVVPTSLFSCICYCKWILTCSNLHVFLYFLLQMNSQLSQPPCFFVFVIADEFSVVPTSMFSCICYCRWIHSCSNLHNFLVFVIADEFSVVPTSMFYCICYCRWILSCSNLHNFLVFVIADEFSVVPTSIISCICYCRWILSCSNLHVFLYLLLQVNSQLLQPPCFLVVVIADEISVVPTSMFFCICYCRWILSCSNLHVFLYLLLQMNSQLFQHPCFLVFVIADEFSVVPISMFSCICYCRWILNCSNIHVFLYLLLQTNSQLFQPPCFLVFVSADEFSVVPTSIFSCIHVIAGEFSVVATSMFSCSCHCRWDLSCSNLHVFLYLLLQMNSQLFQPPCFLVFVIADELSTVPTSMFSCICYCRWILSCSNLHVFLQLLLQMKSQLFQPPCFFVFVIADEFSVVPTSMFSYICYCRWILSCSNLHVFLYLLLLMNSQLFQPPCFLVFVIADEFSVVPTSIISCICYCRWILSCSNLHVLLYLLLQMNSQLFQPP